MNTYRIGLPMVFGTLMGLGLLAGGCSVGDGTGTTEQSVLGTSSLALSLPVDPNFYGNSAYICGKRKKAVDGKYPCLDGWADPAVKDGETGEACECFDFPKTNGYSFNDGDNTAPKKFENLCPSSDVSSDGTTGATWSFGIQIWSGGCKDGKPTGTQLNVDKDANNFACYERSNFIKKLDPNKVTDEILKPGWQENEIVCVTRNAAKEFDFDVCVDARKYDTDPLKYNCGCVAVPVDYQDAVTYGWSTPPKNKCVCNQDGIRDGYPGYGYPLPGAVFDDDCNIVPKAY